VIVGSNPTKGMDVQRWFSLLCCCEYVKALKWTDLHSKESYQISKAD
jgi:hypothetical protein